MAGNLDNSVVVLFEVVRAIISNYKVEREMVGIKMGVTT